MSLAPPPWTVRRVVAPVALLACVAGVAPGQEGAAPDGPERAFLEGLRERGMADYALIEIDRLAADPGAPAGLKAALPYERALTLLAAARTGRAGGDARAQLDQAAKLLEDFADANPNSPLAGDARFLRAEILQQKANDLLGAGDPLEAPEETRKLARRELEEAERVYDDARTELERVIREIGPEQRDEAAIARRDAAAGRLIRARIEGARVIFRQAQTHPVGSAERNRLLDEADVPLEDIRKEYRSQLGALPGRIIQGQVRLARVPDDPAAIEALSAEERGEAVKQLNTALAMLGEVVDQEPPAGAGPAVRGAVDRLRGTAQRLRFSASNHPLKGDHLTVVTQATEWLDGDRARGGTETGAGIIYERGIAHERGAPAEEGRDRTRALRAALADFQTAARRSDAVRGLATLAAGRVRQELGLDQADPTSFAEAFDAAQPLIVRIGEAQAALKAAREAGDAAARAAAQEDLDALVGQVLPLLNAANDLADANTEPGELSRARYLLAYANILAGRYWEAAVLAEYVAENFAPPAPDPEKPDAPDQSKIPLEAAGTAALAWTQAYQGRPAGTDGSFELAQLKRIVGWISEKHPGSERASAALFTLGRVLVNERRLTDAAEVFASVPDSDPRYADAQLTAGDALWRRSLEVARAVTPPPPGESVAELRERAEALLANGVTKAEEALAAAGEDAEPSQSLVVGKATLAQLYNGDGEFQKALDQLTGEPAEVDKLIDVPKKDRPERGVTSALFAKLVYQQLLRAQIGLGDTDAAQKTIEKIQEVSEGGDIGLFKALGEQIQEELEELPPGPERTQARAGLVTFLKKIADSREQTYGSLTWIAETYGGLAASLPEGDPQRTTYYAAAAAAMRQALDKHLPEGDARAATEIAVRSRLAELLAGAGKFEEGYAEVKQVLAEKPNALSVQFVAAGLLSDWGAERQDAATLVKALAGEEPVWGWGKISQMLAQQLRAEAEARRAAGGAAGAAEGDAPPESRFQADYNAARLRIPEVRAALAETKSGAERTAEYEKAERELLSWITLTDPAKIPGETRRDAEELYRSLQTARGVADPQPLPTAGDPAPTADGDDPQLAGAPPAADAAAEPAEADEGPNVVLLIVGLVIFSLVTAGAIFAFRPKPRKRAARRTRGKSAEAAAAEKGKSKGRGSVRSSLPDVAPIPAAAPAAAAVGPTGTNFPDFAALPQKKAARPAAGTAPRTRSGSSGSDTSGRTRRSSSATSGDGRTRRSSSSSSPGATTADGKTVRRRSSSSGSSSGSSGSSSGSPDAPRKPRPKPPAE